MENFGIEMFRCTKSYGDRSKNVNILHVSTDLDGARHEMERIVQFMRKKGFDVRHESIPDMRNGMGVDIVIVGSETASREDAYYLIRHISLGFLGLTLWWDVLWYGTDYTPQPYLPRPMRPSMLPTTHSLWMGSFWHMLTSGDATMLQHCVEHTSQCR